MNLTPLPEFTQMFLIFENLGRIRESCEACREFDSEKNKDVEHYRDWAFHLWIDHKEEGLKVSDLTLEQLK